MFFEEQTVPALIGTGERFERERGLIDPAACRQNALRFAPHRFRQELQQLVDSEVQRKMRRQEIRTVEETV